MLSYSSTSNTVSDIFQYYRQRLTKVIIPVHDKIWNMLHRKRRLKLHTDKYSKLELFLLEWKVALKAAKGKTTPAIDVCEEKKKQISSLANRHTEMELKRTYLGCYINIFCSSYLRFMDLGPDGRTWQPWVGHYDLLVLVVRGRGRERRSVHRRCLSACCLRLRCGSRRRGEFH